MVTKLGYSTYALKMVDPFEALPKIRRIGYDSIEICMRKGWPTYPGNFDISSQRSLAKLSERLGFPSPIFFGSIDVCAPEHSKDEMVKDTLIKFNMAKELHYDDTPILITTTPGHNAPQWDTGKEKIRDAFLHLGDLASEHGIIIAIEAHAGTDFETPDKAIWMIEQTNHPSLKLDLDISHFYVEGAELEYSVTLCAPHSVMVHIKDGVMEERNVKYCLTGEGTIDIPGFISSLELNSIGNLPIYAEVSVQQSDNIDYDPWYTAQFCFDALDSARNKILN